MKPSDFFLNRRQFLGFLVPRALWLASGFWICGQHPMLWLEEALFTRWAVFLVGSYLVGYVMQSFTFIVLDEAKRWRTDRFAAPHQTADTLPRGLPRGQAAAAELEALREHIRSIIAKDPQLRDLNAHQMAQFCKRVAAKDSEFFQAQFLDLEDEVNFTRGVSIPLVFLAVVGFIRSFWPTWLVPDERSCMIAVFALMLFLGGYMYWRFSYVRAAEEEAWYRSFALSWQQQTKADKDQSSTEQEPRSGPGEPPA